MTIDYTITVGAYPTFVDFTDRAQGFQVEQLCGPVMLGTGSLILQLDNSDGELTPNGDGTYAGFDWGSKIIRLTVNRPLENEFVVFHGVVVDIALEDDGSTSRMIVTALDHYAAIGRGVAQEANVSPSTSFYGELPYTIELLINLGTGAKSISGLPLARAGADAAEARVDSVGVVPGPYMTKDAADGYIEENISNRFLVPTLGVIYPTTLTYESSGGTVTLYYEANCVGSGLTNDVRYLGSRCQYTISESPTLGSADLTLNSVVTGHNLDEITNQIEYTTYAGSEFAAQNVTSVNTYGPRTVSFSGVPAMKDEAGYPPSATVDPTPYVEAWVNRFGQYRWTAQRVSTKASQNTSQNAERAFVQLLDVRYGQWVPMQVEYTPTGATSQVVDVGVVKRRVISATPSDTVVSIELLPGDDYQSFTLDSDLLGVLDQNRLW